MIIIIFLEGFIYVFVMGVIVLVWVYKCFNEESKYKKIIIYLFRFIFIEKEFREYFFFLISF